MSATLKHHEAQAVVHRVPESVARSASGPVILGYALLVACLFLAFRSSCASIANAWMTTVGLSHGFLLLGIAIFELVRRLREMQPVRLDDSPVWLIVGAVLASMVYAVGVLAGIKSIELGAMPLIFATATGVYWGWSKRTLAVPALLMIFAVPGFYVLIPALQEIAVAVVSVLTHAAGIPAYVHGHYITLPAGTLEVADGCSGIHQLVVGSLLGVLYVIWNRIEARAIPLVVSAAVLVSLVGNWIRIFILVVVANATNMEHPWIRIDHSRMGWTVFAICQAVFLLILRYLVFRNPLDADCEAVRVEEAPSRPSQICRRAALAAGLALSSLVVTEAAALLNKA